MLVTLTRLLNELPSGEKRQVDLDQLKLKLTPLFRKMEAEYDAENNQIEQCEFINQRVLFEAVKATASCID